MTSKVYVQIKTATTIISPTFSQCLLRLLDPGALKTSVFLESNHNGVILSKADCNRNSLVLQHSPHCPFDELDEKEQDASKGDGVAVAVSIVLESRDHCVLLTKRPAHMRSSPGVWVPPGGHLDLGESLLEGGARELFEETGLSFQDDCDSEKASILCLWENAFPLLLGFGAPKTHAIVIYYHVKSPLTHKQLTARMRIDPLEVGCFTWLPAPVISDIFNHSSPKEPRFTVSQYEWENDYLIEKPNNYFKMFNRYAITKNEVYSGVVCALRNWYLKYESQVTSKF